MTSRRRETEPGIRWWKGARQAYVQVNGKQRSKSFPPNTPTAVLREWRETQRNLHGRVSIAHGSFAADIEEYLGRVRAMPSYKQRAAHLELWADALGRDRSRHSITAAEIDAVMQHWLRTPSAPAKGTKGRPSAPDGIAPATVRKRRTALLSLFNKLNGKQAMNPVRASENPQEPKPEARALDYTTIERIFVRMPESATKRRLTVIAYTGLPPKILAAVTRADLNLKDKTVRVRPRRKGAGVEARTLSLLPQGVQAFVAFDRSNAYGYFRPEAANRSFQRGCKRADVTGATLYDLRHSFGALLYRVTKDLATVSRFLLHASTATSERYAKAAMRSVDEDAATKAGAALEAGRNMSPKPVPKKKPRRRKHLRRAS